ncbi:hypothetical protein GCM10025867_42680 [Frondihabitans sucicola]|uniref:Four-carbon acid sugar kinase nucleotide binding domain-containing protein n=1 Tax=Frondihabitans sucicola TaxID=1268041 RepID=A0ABM8GU68_9MICO|nr:4-hydroxythreonine-4-phosphate dehydrogenase PdxA [Frondihabitans sucicola]BDZ52027.1 hypothetical protein GCM10025867_42680 [Frondihabitans sucicola]
MIGSGSAPAERHAAALRASGVEVVDLDPGDGASGIDGTSRRLSAALHRGSPAALALRSARRADPRDALRSIREVVSRVLGRDPGLDLVMTGGETARVVLDHLGIDSLTPLGQVEHGAVVCRASDGRLVATKPGSFGGPDVLVKLVARVSELRPPSLPVPPTPGDPMDTVPAAASDNRPYIAVTMGDGAGVGPEITVGALVDEAAYRDARPVVIGDAHRLRLGAEALGITVEVVEVNDPSEGVFVPGRINVIDPHLLSTDLPWGQVSAEAGNAAFHYVRIASELGMAGKVQGICTAPLNKAALHEAGHVFPGHTELLAHFMGVGEVSMMLSTPKIKVIHVTTHIGLIDAIAKIEPGLVERTVRRGWEALRRAGVENPRIGVCAINPHAGENGLFGYGEEAEKITPAIEILQAEGMLVAGPLPADTAFFLGGRGDYDLIVAMYHDQGHGPVKVLGIEAGVNITVGLPVIRTSVDHGTAFDIAGTGTVGVGSMIEALRQAVEMSPRPVAA